MSNSGQSDADRQFELVARKVRAIAPALRPRQKEAVLQALARDRELSGADLAVGLAILERLFWAVGVARISREGLALASARSASSVQRAISKLAARGHLVVQRRKIGLRRHDINVYTFPALCNP